MAAIVVNHKQARELLDAVRAQGMMRRRLVCFFGCMYYSGLRPAEVTSLREQDVHLPNPSESSEDEGWGELHLYRSTPAVNKAWTDSGGREERELKHRAHGDYRLVPCPPQLVKLLRDHMEQFGTAPPARGRFHRPDKVKPRGLARPALRGEAG